MLRVTRSCAEFRLSLRSNHTGGGWWWLGNCSHLHCNFHGEVQPCSLHTSLHTHGSKILKNSTSVWFAQLHTKKNVKSWGKFPFLCLPECCCARVLVWIHKFASLQLYHCLLSSDQITNLQERKVTSKPHWWERPLDDKSIELFIPGKYSTLEQVIFLVLDTAS